MCLTLFSNNARSKIAKKDIICYKVVGRQNDTEFFTPFFLQTVKIGKTYHSALNKIGDQIDIGLHSFVYLEECVQEQRSWGSRCRLYIIKCVIPKNSMYFEGFFRKYAGFASDYIMYKELLTI